MSKTTEARSAPLKSPGIQADGGKGAGGKAKVNLTTCPIVPGQDTIIEIVKVRISLF